MLNTYKNFNPGGLFANQLKKYYFCKVKRLIAIMLLFGFISSSTELHELLKLPHLLHHFVEHRTQNPDLSLSAYVYEHYTHNHDNNKDEHHDKGCLPFQGEHTCLVGTSLCSDQVPSGLKWVPQVSLTTAYVVTSDSPSSNFLSKIWQPPKI